MALGGGGGEAIKGVKGGLLRLGIFSAFVTFVVLVPVRFGLLMLFPSDILWASEAICVVGEIGIFVAWPLRRRKAGRILWDLGQGDRSVRLFLLVGLFLFVGVGTIGLATIGVDVGLLEGVLMLLAAVILFIEVKWGSKVTEHGLLRFHSLTPWRDLDVTWTREDGFIAKRIPPRRPALTQGAFAGAALISVMALAALHAWLLPESVMVPDAVRVRFIPDDRYGSPTFEFVRPPGEGLRAVIERRRFDGTSSRFAEVELGEVASRDRLTVWWQVATDSTDPERPFRLTLVHAGVRYEQAIPFPFSREELAQLIVTAPLGTDHPIDQDGAIVIQYARLYVAPEADTPADWRSWMVLLFERVE